MEVGEVLGQEALNEVGVTSHDVVDELLDVDGIEESLTDALVVEGSLLGVEHQEGQAEAVLVLNRSAGALDGVNVCVRHGLHDHGSLSHDGGGTSGAVLLDVPVHGVSRGRLGAVVVLVGHEVDGAAVVAVEAGVSPGAGADGGNVHIVGADGSGENLDNGKTALEQALEGELQDEVDGLVINGADGVNERQEGAVGVVGHVELEGVDNVSGDNVGAIGILGAVAQRDLVLGVGNLLRLAGSKGGIGGVVMQVELIETLEDVPGSAEHQSGGAANGRVVGRAVSASSGDGAALSLGKVDLTQASVGSSEDAGGSSAGSEKRTAREREILHGSS